MGAFEDILRKAGQSTAGSAGGSVNPAILAKQVELGTSLRTANTRLAGSPALVSSGKYTDALRQAAAEISGKGSSRYSRGIGGWILSGLSGAAKNIGYISGLPVRTVASVAKEGADLLTGGGASLKELVTQPFDENFYPSTLISKTGIKWIDAPVGIAVDIAADPLTYMTFGASGYTGWKGRAALATKAAEEANIAKAPSLAAKIADGSILRYGEWALDDVERQVLNVPKGVTRSFGSKAGQVIGKEGTRTRAASEKFAEVIGSNASLLRARIGDFPMLRPIQNALMGKAMREAKLVPELWRKTAGLDSVESLTLKEMTNRLGGYSSAQRGKSLGKSFVNKLAAQHQQLASEARDWEARTGEKIAHYLEDLTLQAPSGSEDLIGKVRKFYVDVREAGNSVVDEFSSRRGVRAYKINVRQNYVNHSLSKEAREYLSSKRWANTRWQSYMKQMVDLTPDEFIRGPQILRGRTLETGKEWLGRKLVTDTGDGTATIKEINDISMDELGFKWFEDDAATYMNSYINSVGNLVKRVGFTDRLFDYGPDVVRGVTKEMIPDGRVVATLNRSLNTISEGVMSIGRNLNKTANKAANILGTAQNVASKVLIDKAQQSIFNEQQLQELTVIIAKALEDFNAADALATARGGEIKEAFDAVTAPYRARLEGIDKALSENDQLELAATMYLEEAHQRMFPKMKNRPSDPREMAAQILAKSESRTASKLKALETRRARLQRSVGPRGKATRAVTAASGAVESTTAELRALDKQIENLNTVVERSSEDFPDGVYFVHKADVEKLDSGYAEGVPVYQHLPEGADPNDFVMAYAPDVQGGMTGRILKPWENGEDYLDFIDGLGYGIGGAINKLGDNQTAEYFGEMWDTVIRSQRGGANALDPTFVEAEPELAGILIRVDKMARRDFSNMSAAEFSSLFDDDMEAVGSMLDLWLSKQSMDPSFPVDVYVDGNDMLYDAIGFIGSSGSGFSDVIGVNIGEFNTFGYGLDTVLNAGHLSRTMEEVPADIADSVLSTAGFDPVGALMGAQASRDIATSMLGTNEQALAAAAEEVARRQAQAASVGRQVGGVRSSASQLEGRVSTAAETVRKAQEAIDIPQLKGGTKTVSRAEAEAQSASTARKLQAEQRKLDTALKNDPVIKGAAKKGDELRTAQASMDAASSLRGELGEWKATYGQLYEDDLKTIQDLLLSRPPTKGSAGEVSAEWLRSTTQALENLRALELPASQKEALEKVILQLKGYEAQVAIYESAREFTVGQMDRVMNGEFGNVLRSKIERGWSEIESLGVQMPPEIADMLFNRIRSLSTPAEWGKFRKIYNAYTRFFKISAMFTAGFIVRNSYTAAFNNFVAGVTLAETKEGIAFAIKANRLGINAALESVPAAERDLYEQAYRVYLATGGGQTTDDLLYPVLTGKGGRLLSTKPFRAWTQANEGAELAARMSLALSSLRRGLDMDAAAAQVARYHFDYTDLSKVDEVMRNFIPFWIFASRNIPLQMVNQVARPSLYRAYESVQRNLPPDENLVLPSWLEAQGPLGFSKGAVLNPDLPQLELRGQMAMMADPMRLLSQFNPAIKLIPELLGSRQYATDVPFSDKPQMVRGPLDIPAFLGGALFGQSGFTAQGQPYTSSKAAYAVPNLLPPLAQLQRYIPQLGGKESYVQRQGSSIASALGVPYRGISEQEQLNELTRRQFALRDYLANLTRTGYLEPQ